MTEVMGVNMNELLFGGAVTVICTLFAWIMKIIFMWVKNVNKKLSGIHELMSEADLRVMFLREIDPVKLEIISMRGDFKEMFGMIVATARESDANINKLVMQLLHQRDDKK